MDSVNTSYHVFQTSFPMEIVINKLLPPVPLMEVTLNVKILGGGWQRMGESCELINWHVYESCAWRPPPGLATQCAEHCTNMWEEIAVSPKNLLSK